MTALQASDLNNLTHHLLDFKAQSMKSSLNLLIK